MARKNFDPCLAELLRHEGGYVNHPKDPGGETNFGISKRSYPKEDIKGLTPARAGQIYRRDFWQPQNCDLLPAGIDNVVFDPSVNSGRSRGAKWTQAALGVKADGVIGGATITAALKADPVQVIRVACANRMGMLRGLKTWGAFGKGWSRRVAEVEAFSVRLALDGSRRSLPTVAAESARAAEAQARREVQKAGQTVAGGAAGGGASWSLADLPDWSLMLIGAAVVVAVVVLIGQRRHELERARAYRAIAGG